jgi:hypothetical protein
MAEKTTAEQETGKRARIPSKTTDAPLGATPTKQAKRPLEQITLSPSKEQNKKTHIDPKRVSNVSDQPQVSETTSQQNANNRSQKLKDTPPLHQKTLNFAPSTEPPQTPIQDENIDIIDEEERNNDKNETNPDSTIDDTMTDNNDIWDSSIKQTWDSNVVPNIDTSNVNTDPVNPQTNQQEKEGNISNFIITRLFAKNFIISPEGMAVDLIELCDELFDYGDISINHSKISMSGKSVVIQFINESDAEKAVGHKGTYLTYENVQSHAFKQSSYEDTYYRVTAIFTKTFRGVFSTPNEVKNFLLNTKLSDNFRKEGNFDSFKFKTQADGKTILSIYLNNRESWIELSKQDIVRGPKGYIRVLGHLSATNDKNLTHLWMGNLKDLTDGVPIIRALEFRKYHPVIASIAHDQKRGIPKGFGFIYMTKDEAEQMLKLDPPLMYEKEKIKFSATVRASDLISR